MKATIACDVVLAYPYYPHVFDIYTDASSRQLGAVIPQRGRPIAFLVESYLQRNKSIQTQSWNYYL